MDLTEFAEAQGIDLLDVFRALPQEIRDFSALEGHQFHQGWSNEQWLVPTFLRSKIESIRVQRALKTNV